MIFNPFGQKTAIWSAEILLDSNELGDDASVGRTRMSSASSFRNRALNNGLSRPNTTSNYQYRSLSMEFGLVSDTSYLHPYP